MIAFALCGFDILLLQNLHFKFYRIKHSVHVLLISECILSLLQSWFLLIVSVLAVLLGAASAVGVTVATVRVIMWEGHTLFAHCDLPANMTYYSITNECPFDPTRIYVSRWISSLVDPSVIKYKWMIWAFLRGFFAIEMHLSPKL